MTRGTRDLQQPRDNSKQHLIFTRIMFNPIAHIDNEIIKDCACILKCCSEMSTVPCRRRRRLRVLHGNEKLPVFIEIDTYLRHLFYSTVITNN